MKWATKAHNLSLKVELDFTKSNTLTSTLWHKHITDDIKSKCDAIATKINGMNNPYEKTNILTFKEKRQTITTQAVDKRKKRETSKLFQFRSKRKHRPIAACDRCRRQKISCSSKRTEDTCTECEHKNKICTYKDKLNKQQEIELYCISTPNFANIPAKIVEEASGVSDSISNCRDKETSDTLSASASAGGWKSWFN
ncbi:3350_t:CDS:2 [Dentiscutata heterogama]|uniref:3350_t:CDS:1 n=1 Tax=Dentiscutata heterogama TaxID=1316150 RepID=A0ACA9L894_9GLOM|nr:3350_t:CDS:2 [Dentiscutata heterogama]